MGGGAASVHRKPRGIDLFCGMGGMSLGMRRAGVEPVAAVDIWPEAVETYAANFPGVDVAVGDVADPEFRKRFVKRWKGQADVVAGGPPCQKFSVMNRFSREGSDLPLVFARLACDLEPRHVVMEEVPQVASMGGGEHLDRVVRQFEARGYVVKHAVLNAKDYRVPQSRKRLVLVASRHPVRAFPPKPQLPVRVVGDVIKKPYGRGSTLITDEKALSNIARGFSYGLTNPYQVLDMTKPSPTVTTEFHYASSWRVIKGDDGEYFQVGLEHGKLLMSFPKSWKIPAGLSNKKAGRMIGNAVPPRMLAAVFRALLR